MSHSPPAAVKQASYSDDVTDSGTIRAPRNTFEMDDSQTLPDVLEPTSSRISVKKGVLAGVARHTLGLILLLMVVFLWTLSNFLGSSIFADNSYAKPFFLTYLNTSVFTMLLIPTIIRTGFQRHREGTLRRTIENIFSRKTMKALWRRRSKDDVLKEFNNDPEAEGFLKPDTTVAAAAAAAASIPRPRDDSGNGIDEEGEYLNFFPTARLALAFCILWFVANYFAMACLQYTTVASTTILTSTSSVWTLLFGALTRTEKFTWRKLCGVLASLVGIVLISQVDLGSSGVDSGTGGGDGAGNIDNDRMMRRALDEFPDKTPYELALGDALALLSAVIYGFYTITLKKTTDEARPKSVHMPTFFGMVGLFNAVLLLPLFPVFHLSGLERFELPPSRRIWMILLINSISSLLSDICWAYAMVLTSPLVVTVGLSLTIPLSLVGEMVVQGRFESWIYWVGAMIVVGSFVFVDREEKHEEQEESSGDRRRIDFDIEIDEGEPGPAIVVDDFDQRQMASLSRLSSESGEDLLDSGQDGGDEDVQESRHLGR